MPRNPKCPPSTPTSSSLARTRLGSKPRPSSATVSSIAPPRRATLTRWRDAPEWRGPLAGPPRGVGGRERGGGGKRGEPGGGRIDKKKKKERRRWRKMQP